MTTIQLQNSTIEKKSRINYLFTVVMYFNENIITV